MSFEEEIEGKSFLYFLKWRQNYEVFVSGTFGKPFSEHQMDEGNKDVLFTSLLLVTYRSQSLRIVSEMEYSIGGSSITVFKQVLY